MANKPFFFFSILLAFLAVAGGDSGQGSELDYSKLSGIIIPGFASTQLRAWSILDCPYSPLDFNPLDLVWLDTTKVRTIFIYLRFSTSFCIFCIMIQSYRAMRYDLFCEMFLFAYGESFISITILCM